MALAGNSHLHVLFSSLMLSDCASDQEAIIVGVKCATKSCTFLSVFDHPSIYDDYLMPTLLIRMSQLPNRFCTSAANAVTSPGLVTSVFIAIAWPPAASASAIVSLAFFMSATATRAPSSASSLTNACPIPLAPPVLQRPFHLSASFLVLPFSRNQISLREIFEHRDI